MLIPERTIDAWIAREIGTMAVWLRRHAVDVRVVAVSVLRDEDRLYVSPQVLIPVPSEERLQAKASVGSSDKSWLIDGQSWHLEQRCSPKDRTIVEALVDIVARAAPDAVGPNWGQKFYVSWRSGARNWAWLNTGSNRGVLDVWAGNLSPQEAAERVGFAVFQDEADLSTKLALGSSVGSVGEGRLLRLNVKSASDVQGPRGDQLAELLRESWQAFSADQAGAVETVGVIPLLDEVEPSVPVIGGV